MTVLELLGAAAVTGGVGGVHCAAMCGPLAAAGCPRGTDTAGYFAGRLVSYATLGAVFGWLGHCAGHAGTSGGVLPALQVIALAAVALAAAWRGVTLLRPRRPRLHRIGRRPAVWRWLAASVPRQGLGLGLATGILPCGMLMAGWMLAAVAGGPVQGAAVMAVFAMATAPGLLVPILGRRVFGRALQRVPPRIAGIAWCLLAVWLAVRPFMHAHHAM